MLGALNGLRALPFLVSGPAAGVIADRMDRRRLMLVAQSVLLFTALGMGVLVLSGYLEVWHLFAFTLVTGIAWSFNQPVRQTLVPAVVPKEDLANAVALNSAGFNITKVAGPTLGGLLLRVHNVGPEGLGMLNALPGVGALAGSLAVAYFSSSSRKEFVQAASGVGFGVFLLVFAMAASYGIALAAALLLGAASNVYMALNNTLVMTSTDPRMHGRVMSIYMMTFAVMPISALPMSVLADVVGPQPTLAGAGALLGLAVGALSLLARGGNASPPATQMEAAEARR